ncbi:MAG: hypothetical protein E6L08_01080 [Verrucomicrobia bacterium]|nr:MAG: hypothetical protein E6L08_01080 [Verrucomicrobiota bacterium]
MRHKQLHEHRRNSVKLVVLHREKKWLEAISSLYASKMVSVEAQDIGENAGRGARLDPVL